MKGRRVRIIVMESPFHSQPVREIPPCPICEGVLECVYSRFGERVYVCMECHTSMTVPKNAWEVAAVKQAQRGAKPDQKTG